MAYGTDDGLIEWLAAQGLPSPAGDPAVLRQIGSNYIDAAYGYKLTCSRRTGGWEQDLEFPRTGHYVNGQLLPSTLIPTAWIYASYRAAYLEDMTPGWATDQVTPGRVTKRERVDSVEREFFDQAQAGGGAASAPGFPSDAVINGLVLQFLCSNTRGLNSLFRVV